MCSDVVRVLCLDVLGGVVDFVVDDDNDIDVVWVLCLEVLGGVVDGVVDDDNDFDVGDDD